MFALRHTRRATLTVILLLAAAVPVITQAQEQHPEAVTKETYLRPAPDVAEAVLAPRHLNVTLGNPSPDGRFFLHQRGEGAPTIATFAKPFYRLGGMQIDWRANRERRMTTRSGTALNVTDGESGNSTAIQVPDGAGVSSPTWSPDGSQIAFFVHLEDATHIFVADPTSGRSRQVTRKPVLATLQTSFEWTPDSRSIVTVLVPDNRGAPPVEPQVPTGPQVRITTPDKNRLRTYPDLLEGPHEKALVEYYSTGQLAVVDVRRRRARTLGQPAMIREIEVSPDGNYLRVSTMQTPFSYIAPTRQAGTKDELWTMEDGAIVALLSEQEVRDGTSTDSTASDADPDKRNFAWRPDGSLGFLQMVPERDGDSTASDEDHVGDRVFQWLPPYDSASTTVIYESNSKLSSVRYSTDAQTLFLTEQTGERVHEYAVLLSDPETKHTIWRGKRTRFSFRRGTPRLLTRTLDNGASVVRTSLDGASVFMSGIDYADDPMTEGPTSYIERIEIESGDKERVYESENDGVYERVLGVLNDDATQLLVSREGPVDVPDSYLRNVSTGTLKQLTENTDYTPDITHAQRTRYAVSRVDGFEFAVDVTLPRDWSGERLPGMIWFYPREYTDQDGYDETRETYNKNAFPNLRARSMDILVEAGYAVIEPDAPIIGDRGRMNDNYVNDLRNNLAATIDFLDKKGIVDRERMGVGGHSYGAFGAVNAMVHTPFFKAGIAGDGNYNRTLTPFSFQSERRTLWQSKDTYFSMSPLFFADHLNGALLMYHGADDQNTGTFPINSWRLFESLESLGKTAALYVYPFEEHGPATEETLLDLWARWTAWLDKYVKNAGQEEKITTDAVGAGSN